MIFQRFFRRGIDNLLWSCVSFGFFAETTNLSIYLFLMGGLPNTTISGIYQYYYSTVNFIKPYRSVKPRRIFLICSFLRQSGRTKIFKLLF